MNCISLLFDFHSVHLLEFATWPGDSTQSGGAGRGGTMKIKHHSDLGFGLFGWGGGNESFTLAH